MRWSLGIGSIAGIRIEIHVTFLLFIAWMALSRGVLAGDPAQGAITLVLLLLVFSCVLLHELGHALTARRFGIQTRDIILLPFGGLARLQRMPERPIEEVLVALAGPAVNVVIAGVLLAFAALSREPIDPTSFHGGLLQTVLAVNVLMVLFNMIPAFPMDGGRVLRATLAMRMPYARATRIAALVGQAIALVFGLTGLATNNYMLLLIAVFVFFAAGEERAMVESRASMAGLPVRDAMVTDFQTIEADEPLQRAVDQLIAGSQQDFPVLERGAPVGMLTRSDLVLALQRHGNAVPVRDVMRKDEDYADVSEPLEDAFRRMREQGRTALPVVQEGNLVGLVTLENIGDLLSVRGALRRFARRA